MQVSPRRRRDIIDALRRGTVPQRGLDVMAVGLDRFTSTVDQELESVAGAGAQLKAVRGEYGSGKTFFARWLTERAKDRGFASSEIQISETETPLHRLETVYRRIVENLTTAEAAPSALREVIDGWFHILRTDVVESGVPASDEIAVQHGIEALLEARLAAVAKTAPSFATALRGYRAAMLAGDTEQADGLLAWLGGQPNVAASVRRGAASAATSTTLGHWGSCRGCSRCCATLTTPGWSSCSMRSRPCSGCARTYERSP